MRYEAASHLGAERQQFDYRNGWTKMGNYFADGYFTREEMRELVRSRFGITPLIVVF